MGATGRAAVVDLMASQRVRALIIAGSIASDDPALDRLDASPSRLTATGARIASIGANSSNPGAAAEPSRLRRLAEQLLARWATDDFRDTGRSGQLADRRPAGRQLQRAGAAGGARS